jgi:hypothetical protein
MIARLRILLPYVISVESSATLASHQWTVHGRQVAVVPFYQPRLTADAMGDWGDSVGALFEGLAPSDAPILDLNTTVGGNPAIPATVLQVEEWQATFDRSRAPPAPLPPPASEQIAFLFEIANSVLARFRSIARAAHIHPVSPHTTCCRSRSIQRTCWSLGLRRLVSGLMRCYHWSTADCPLIQTSS